MSRINNGPIFFNLVEFYKYFIMIYHIFWNTTHYICENINSAIKLQHAIGGGFIISDISPFLQDYIDKYRSIL